MNSYLTHSEKCADIGMSDMKKIGKTKCIALKNKKTKIDSEKRNSGKHNHVEVASKHTGI